MSSDNRIKTTNVCIHLNKGFLDNSGNYLNSVTVHSRSYRSSKMKLFHTEVSVNAILELQNKVKVIGILHQLPLIDI